MLGSRRRSRFWRQFSTAISLSSIALTDWGKAHRFAGSGDRNAIGGLVYDALRRRASLAWALGSDTPRSLAIGAASSALGLSPEERH